MQRGRMIRWSAGVCVALGLAGAAWLLSEGRAAPRWEQVFVLAQPAVVDAWYSTQVAQATAVSHLDCTLSGPGGVRVALYACGRPGQSCRPLTRLNCLAGATLTRRVRAVMDAGQRLRLEVERTQGTPAFLRVRVRGGVA